MGVKLVEVVVTLSWVEMYPGIQLNIVHKQKWDFFKRNFSFVCLRSSKTNFSKLLKPHFKKCGIFNISLCWGEAVTEPGETTGLGSSARTDFQWQENWFSVVPEKFPVPGKNFQLPLVWEKLPGQGQLAQPGTNQPCWAVLLPPPLKVDGKWWRSCVSTWSLFC